LRLGIALSLLGAPFFLWLLVEFRRRGVGMGGWA
jgi:ABC-type Fe3+-siderophore transport system permease subunit